MLIIAILTISVYPIIGYFLWLNLECKHYADGYTRWRTGSGKVYILYWPLLLLREAIRAFKLLWYL